MDRHVDIRPAECRDIPRLLGLMQALAAEEGAVAALHADEASLLRDGFGAFPRFRALVAEAGPQVVGYATCTTGYSIWSANSTLLLDDLYVAPGYRSMGVGRDLLDAVGRLCVEERHVHVRWTVEPGNSRAIAFYTRMGARLARKGLCTWIPEAVRKGGARKARERTGS